MPIYEYLCNHCEKVVEILVRRMTKKQKVSCPYCGEANIQRVWITPPTIETNSTGGGYPYFSENLADTKHPQGQWVQNRKHRKKLMKEQKVRDAWS